MGAAVTVRAATGGDVEAILRLANDRRHLYATYQPVFWRVAADAVARHRPHLSALVDDEAAITLVAATDQSLIGFAVGRLVPPPPVYDPGGVSCFVDDFAVADPADWLTAGVDLLRAVCQAARERGAAQIVVVTGQLDEAKRAALAVGGLSVASEWWVAALDVQ